MNSLSYDSHFIVANNPYSQQQWMRENKMELKNDKAAILEVARKQVDRIRPDILYLTDPITFDSRFIRLLSWKPKLVLGWRAANIPADTDWSEFDVIMSSLSGIRNTALKLGAKSVEHFFPGFPEWINTHVGDVKPEFDVVFSGTWSLNQHPHRNRYLNVIADEASKENLGFTCAFYINGQKEILPASVAKYNLGPRFGIAMHQALNTGRIVVDGRGILELKHSSKAGNIDLAGKQTANMRIFEATGSGCFLLTEYHDNLQEYFRPGVEIETFRNEKELTEKIYYYLDNPEERKAIARRGQERCLREYSMAKRASEFDHIIHKHLESKFASKSSKRRLTLEIKTQAEKLIENGNYIAAFKSIIQAKTLKVPTYGLDYLRALCFIHMNNHGNALEAIREELRLFPSNQEAKILFDKLSDLNQIPDNVINDSEFNNILKIVKPYTLLSPQRLYSLFDLARQVCDSDMPGNFVECGVAAGGSTALLAYMIKSRSKRPRKIYAFDSFEGMPAPTAADTHQGIPAEDTGWGSGTCYATEDSVREICGK
ncbi:MAG: glycosyltransferase, partial [Cyclobacteriaceae bacterium]|nr:glycosyltransferase [Cyclobacteriaceae bacterium]